MESPMLEVLQDWAAHGLWHAGIGTTVAYTLLTCHLTIVAVTVYLHRSQAHRALDLHPALRHFFRLWLWLATGMSTRQWVAVHRKHHAKCETEEDPHSPVVKGIGEVMLRGAELYRAEAANATTLERFGHGTPDDWLERRVYAGLPWQGVGAMLILDLLLFGAIGATVWAVQMLWIPFWAAGVVNGLGHWWGYRNFSCRDASRNVSPWGLIIGGEELHNNHHTFPTSAKLSIKWWEFDLGWGYIRLFSALGLARVRKLPPKARLGEVRPLVDPALLQSVIANRYDLMARYARELRRALREELRRVRASGGAPSQLRALRVARRLVTREPDTLDAPARAVIDAVASDSTGLRTLLRMREELSEVWLHSSASAEQLRQRLQDWCQRAEHSGIAALRSLSLRVRSYA
jgi:stearoyl-CoA desaturase (delta-9 desaturase)